MDTVDPAAGDAPRVDGRTLRYKDHRARLLRGTIEYVLEHGVSELSLRPLAESLGVSHASLRNNFGTKEELIIEVVDSLWQQSLRMSAEREQAAVSSVGLEPFERWYATWTKDEFLPAITVIFEAFGLALRRPEAYHAFLTHAFADWLGLTRTFLSSLGCPDDEATDHATLMVGLMYGLQLDLLTTGDHARVDRAHARFVAMLRECETRW